MFFSSSINTVVIHASNHHNLPLTILETLKVAYTSGRKCLSSLENYF